MLAMDVNDDAGFLDARVVLAFFASVLAPTRVGDPPTARSDPLPVLLQS